MNKKDREAYQDKYRDAYKEEAYELLSELETSLLDLEETPKNMGLINRVFRALHTIKGTSAMFGFEKIADFTHEVETVFEQVRNGEVPVTKEMIDLTLSSGDLIRALLEPPDGNEASSKETSRKIIDSLKKLAAKGTEEEDKGLPSPASSSEVPSCTDNANATYRIRFRPAAGTFTQGTNPLLLLDELRKLGECSIVAQTNEIPCLNDYNPETCYTYWDAILTTCKGLDAIQDVFILVVDDAELSIKMVDDGENEEADLNYKKLGEILVERGDLTPEQLKKTLSSQKRIGEMLEDAGLVDASQIQSALAEQEHVRKTRKKGKAEGSSTIRVASEKLDKLVDLVGELVTVQVRLSQTASGGQNQELNAIAEEVERLTKELRDNTMRIRMVTIGTTFSKFKRLVRNLSNELGREIELTIDGAETEIDKIVIEKLGDSLVHLIRNSIDHGIEDPEQREASGKPRQGLVNLSASHSGPYVIIKVSDDGAGLDSEAIRARGIERGLITPDAELSEKQIYSLLLEPGFSMAKKVTHVSGRGVGMDIVKRSIESLQGSIDIWSVKGIGTSISLKLPRTLAIIKGLLVKVGGHFFVLPLSAVEEYVELTQEDTQKTRGRDLAHVRGEVVPFIRLREVFKIESGKPEIEQIVITAADNHRVGFVVDDVIEDHQTVIKTLGKVYRNVVGISGATILGDGTVALILDIGHLYNQSEKEQGLCTVTG